MPLCIPPEYFGKTGFEDIFQIKDSLQREKKLGEFFDLKTAKDINNRFEKVKLLKKTEQGLENMIKTIKGLDVKKREEFLAKLKAETERKAALLEDMQTSGEVKTNEIMDIENLSKDIYNKKNGLDISDADSKRLMEATNIAEQASKLENILNTKKDINKLTDAEKKILIDNNLLYAKARHDVQKLIGEITTQKRQVLNKNGKLVNENKFFGEDSKMARETANFSKAEKLAYFLEENRKFISSSTFKAMKATWDLSTIGIQGARIFLTHPKIAYNSFKEAFKVLGGKKAWEAWNVLMLSERRFSESIAMGARMSTEEQLIDNVLSNRTDNFFTASLQRARYKIYESSADLMEKKLKRKLDPTDANYESLVEKAKKDYKEKYNIIDTATETADEIVDRKYTRPVKDSKLLKEAASDANKITGTTNLGKGEVLSPALNETFFAARYALSDVRMFTDVLDPNISWIGRKRAAKTLGQSMGSMLAGYWALAQAFPDATETDPTAANFMRFRIGDKWYGIKMPGEWLFKLVAKGILQREKNKAGDVTEFDPDAYNGKTFGSTFLRTFRSKLAPIPAVLTDIATGKDYIGRKATPAREILNLAAPITTSGILERAWKSISGDEQRSILEQLINAGTDGLGVTSYND